jgi:membrane-associated phospholipid phosphatase
MSSTTISAEASGQVRIWVAKTLREFAVQDWLIVGYFLILLLAAVQGTGAMRTVCISRVLALLGLIVITLFSVRGQLLKHGLVGPLLYRIVIYGSVQVSYFLLHDLLPVASPGSLDQQLYELDVRVFGFEPTLWADQFVNAFTTEWFAFFYFSYFFILGAYFWTLTFFSRRLYLLAEFSLTLFMIFCAAHLLYMVVPGYGPYKHLAHMYQHSFPSGYWYNTVIDAVKSGGAQKDIFPSLHTAAPTAIALFSFRHRDKLPFKYVWQLTAFFVINIIGATIFLRWHYLIDVVAGFSLAVVCVLLGARLTSWETNRRLQQGASLVWPSFFQQNPIDGPAPKTEESTPSCS